MSPFRSKAQIKFMYENHPEIAKRWAKETTNMRSLPRHVKKTKMSKPKPKKPVKGKKLMLHQRVARGLKPKG